MDTNPYASIDIRPNQANRYLPFLILLLRLVLTSPKLLQTTPVLGLSNTCVYVCFVYLSCTHDKSNVFDFCSGRLSSAAQTKTRGIRSMIGEDVRNGNLWIVVGA